MPTADYKLRYAEAQQTTTYTIGGREYPRIRYGDEGQDWGANRQDFHDCAVHKGDYHLSGCDIERCPRHPERQSISCNCDDE